MMTSLAVLAQTKGLAFWFQCAMKASMCLTSWETESKEPRRTDFLVRTPNHAATRLIQDAPVGLK